MRSPIFLLISLIALGGCASSSTTSPYITACHIPACNVTATPIENHYQEVEGIAITASPALEFTVDNALFRISQQDNILLLLSNNGWKLGTTTLSIADIGLEDTSINIHDFMDLVFLKDFKTLETTKPSDVILHSVRGFKLSSFDLATPAYFKRDHLTVFYYLTEKTHLSKIKNQYQIIVLDNRNPDTATMIDLYDFTEERFQRFISTLHSYAL